MNTRHNFRSACYVFLCKDNKVLLARRFQTGYKDGQYSTMAGHVEPNETIVDCAIREVKEEAVVAVKAENLKLFHIMNRHSDYDYLDFFFSCKKWEGKPQIGEPNLCDDLSWCEIDKLPDNTIDYVKEALIYIGKKISFSKYAW